MTGTDRSEEALQERRRQEQRKRWAGVTTVAVLLLILLAFMVPWLLGRRQVSGELRAVATLKDPQCWNTWTVTGDGATRHVLTPPESWIGTTSMRGEISFQGGDEYRSDLPYFVVESGERYLLESGLSSGPCVPPPSTVPLR